jgi:hypothetical protein
MSSDSATFSGGPAKAPPPPTPEDPEAIENRKKAEAAERGQRGRASTMLASRTALQDANVFRRSLLGQ